MFDKNDTTWVCQFNLFLYANSFLKSGKIPSSSCIGQGKTYTFHIRKLETVRELIFLKMLWTLFKTFQCFSSWKRQKHCRVIPSTNGNLEPDGKISLGFCRSFNNWKSFNYNNCVPLGISCLRKKWASKTQVMSCELRFHIYKLRVQIYKLRV